MHKHIELNHAYILLYCKTCDVVYCESCKKEWKQGLTTWKYNTTPVWDNTCNKHFTVPNDTTAAVSGSLGVYLEPVGCQESNPFDCCLPEAPEPSIAIRGE